MAANGGVEGGATERAVLLSLSAVGSEGVGERAGGRGGVNARRVVDGLWNMRLVANLGDLELGKWEISRTRDGALANEANERSTGSAAEDRGNTHCGSYVGIRCVEVGGW